MKRPGDTNCPCHNDDKASLSINPGTKPPYVAINCHAGCDSNDILTSKGLNWNKLHKINKQGGFRLNGPSAQRRNKKPERLPTIEECQAWHQALLSNVKLLRYFTNRGLSLKTIKRHLIGWDARRKRYTFPVINDDGNVVQLARYNRWAEGDEPKFTVVRGHDHALYLWDDELKDQTFLLWCEGQWDALIARQHGLPAFTTTGGAGTVKQEWIEAVADVGVPVAIALDCDEPGNKGAAKRAEGLAAEGATVKVVKLGLEEHEDVNDWFVKYGRTAKDLVRLIKQTDLYESPVSPQRDSWPVLDEAAFYGLAGEVVRTLEPYTEADPVGVLVTFLSMFGNAVGRGAFIEAGHRPQPAKLWPNLIGDTARARKGTARAAVKLVFQDAAPEWSETSIRSGLSSGEGLIAALNDRRRLFIQEPEFGRVLTVAGREGHILSAVIRELFDGDDVYVMNKNKPLEVRGAYASIGGDITIVELKQKLSETEAANGFANRFLFTLVRRSKLLPRGPNISGEELQTLARKTKNAIREAKRIRELTWQSAAGKRFDAIYTEIAERPALGMFGAVTARAETQVVRLAVTYALLDGSALIKRPHLEAAWAVWRYCEASAAYIFGTATGSRIADRILAALQEAEDGSIDRLSIYGLLGNNVSKQQIDTGIDVLRRMKLAEAKELRTGRRGRPKQIVRKL